ncbi:MAG: prepilin-type N-terminal cleavage/methylation domain-containing protein [Verrucomicrobiota bacterium]
MKHVFPKLRGFTLIELLVVITIITILAGLTISTMSYAQNSAGRNRAKAEVNALSLAIESYKIDNGDYPRDANTDALNAVAEVAKCSPGPNTDALTSAGVYNLASLALYKALSGDTDCNRVLDATEKTAGGRVYFPFKPGMLYPRQPVGSTATVQAIIDPFKNVYGYSTKNLADVQANAPTPGGYNPTFDLWSTADHDQKGLTPAAAWITNW